ncbi:MAG: septum formation initiator family protein [Blastochloris sp.]|jgi:cell division protein FtsB|nr:septum formation initiator family protein [Blastochloris sp.]
MGARSKIFDPRSIKTAVRADRGDLWQKLLPWLSSFVVILIITLGCTIYWPVFKKNQDYVMRKTSIQREIEEQQAFGLKLQDELYALQDDPIYIERTARDVLNMGKEGEVIFRFPAYQEKRNP